MLRRSLAAFKRSWVQALPWVIFQINDIPGVDNAHSPHKIVFGRDPIGLGDSPPLHQGRFSATAEEWFQNLSTLRSKVHKTVTSIHDDVSKNFRQKNKNVTFEPGDRVWVRNLPHHQADKLDPCGPAHVKCYQDLVVPEGIKFLFQKVSRTSTWRE